MVQAISWADDGYWACQEFPSIAEAESYSESRARSVQLIYGLHGDSKRLLAIS
jgi:hypothetical protein